MSHPDKLDEPLMVQHKDVPVSGISLTKEGEGGKYTVVKAEIGGAWIEIIRVLSDTQFSHIMAFEDKGKPCQVAEPECHHCGDTGWRQFGFGPMDLEPCGCKADLGAAP